MHWAFTLKHNLKTFLPKVFTCIKGNFIIGQLIKTAGQTSFPSLIKVWKQISMQAPLPHEKPSHDEGSKPDPEVTSSWSCSCIAQVWKASALLEDGFGNTTTFRRSCPQTLVISLALKLSTAQLYQHCCLLGWAEGNFPHVINSGRLFSQATSKPDQEGLRQVMLYAVEQSPLHTADNKADFLSPL